MGKFKDPWPRQRHGIGSVWRDHWRTGRQTLEYVSARLATSMVVWLLVGIALALPAGLFLLQSNLARLTHGWEGRPGLTLYFDLDAEVAQIRSVERAFAERVEIADTELTSRESALAEFQKFSNLGDALKLLGENPLPASLRATLTGDTTVDDLDELARFGTTLTGVNEVVLEKTWLERITQISQLINRLGLVLATLFGLGAVLVTSTSVRLAIEARLEEIRVMKLVGATDSQIRRPFLYFGAIYGVGGGMMAAMLLSATLLVIETPISRLVGSYDDALEIIGFDPDFLAGLLLVGGLLGVVGALLAARQRLADLQIL